MYICIYIEIDVCVSIYICRYVPIYAYTCVYIYMYRCKCACLFIDLHYPFPNEIVPSLGLQARGLQSEGPTARGARPVAMMGCSPDPRRAT